MRPLDIYMFILMSSTLIFILFILSLKEEKFVIIYIYYI